MFLGVNLSKKEREIRPEGGPPDQGAMRRHRDGGLNGMDDKLLNRKEFLTAAGKACACVCVGALAAGLSSAYAQDSTKTTDQKQPEEPQKKPRSEERVEFADKWLVRFFDVFDANLDEATRKKIMMANGKACLLAWYKETNQQPRPEPLTLERLAAWAEQNKREDYRVEGNVIHFQYLSAAETGLPAPENKCLCTLVESKPAGLSPTYCYCSVGYVKEMHEQLFKKPVEVELVSAVLRGDPRCKFKITVS